MLKHNIGVKSNTWLVFALGVLPFISGQTAYAASFDITNGVVATTQQTLFNNDSGIIRAGGTLSTTATAITAAGSNITVNNAGIVSVTGNFTKAVDLTLSGTSSFINSGTISISGSTVVAVDLQVSDNSIVLTNQASGVISSDEANGTVLQLNSRNSDNASLSNAGTISGSGSSPTSIVAGGGAQTVTFRVNLAGNRKYRFRRWHRYTDDYR